MAATPTPIDPRLTEEIQPRAQAVTLPTRTIDDLDGASDGEGVEGSEKRRKLNLWKCRQCRDARKKCFPADRTWPQKCERCLSHRPEPLPCSEPELNTRKRGPNIRDKDKTKDKDKDPKPLRRSKTASTPDRQEPRSRPSSDDEDGGGSTDDAAYFERPLRTMVLKGIKRDHPGSPIPETPLSPLNKEDRRPASCYLPLGEGEFRILQLAPGRKDDKNISCSFITASMSRPMKYEAISYLWAAPHQKSMEIQLVDPQGKSHAIYIRSNLYAALQNLRHPTRTRSFWVDALCINYGRTDMDEKNRQIAMKRYVFRNAANLCFWLGEDDSSKKALRFIPRILDLTGIDKLVKDDSAIDDWAAFVALLKNPVFSRLWLVQEVAVAQNVTLHCGQPAIHYGDLVDAVAMFGSFRTELSILFRKNGRNYKELTDRKVTMAERFIEVSTNALRITNSRTTQRLLSLEELVSHLSDLSASNPLDRIYSVLAIAKDGPKLDERTLMPSETHDIGALQIDYDRNVVDVYQDFVIRAIMLSRSLDIICRHWAGLADHSLPTWVRPLQLLQPPFDSNISERTEADSLVDLPDHNYYHASRGTVAKFRVFELPESGMSTSLIVTGFRIDTISKLAPRASEGIILYEWLELGGCVKYGEVMAEEFWRTSVARTLVADRGPNGSNPPSWYTRAFDYCLHHLTPTGDINTNRLIDQSEGESSLVVEFLQRVQSVIWNRKFLVSKKHAWIGLAPMATLEEDIICILYGCSVPVVLRPVRDSFNGFHLVGECYVHGIMDGEATEIALATGDREEEFMIR